MRPLQSTQVNSSSSHAAAARASPFASAATRAPSVRNTSSLMDASRVRHARYRRRAVGVERLEGLQAPGLALLALGFGPADRFPVRRQHQPRAGAGDFDAVAARLVDVKEEGLLDGVLVRPGLDEHAVLQENIGGAQHVLA